MRRKFIILIMIVSSYSCFEQDKAPFLVQEVTITFSNIPLKEALRKLEQELDGLVFMYSPSSFDSERKINLSFEKTTLEALLERLFKEDDISFLERKNKILLKPKNVGNEEGL
ncbi:STN domain-containing protein [Roseivirga sp.]|uniref:STN domain-containing protein n=1 Tax=Roseivirga sp. TaxID=1964215 RepID=UPI003B8CFD89